MIWLLSTDVVTRSRNNSSALFLWSSQFCFCFFNRFSWLETCELLRAEKLSSLDCYLAVLLLNDSKLVSSLSQLFVCLCVCVCLSVSVSVCLWVCESASLDRLLCLKLIDFSRVHRLYLKPMQNFTIWLVSTCWVLCPSAPFIFDRHRDVRLRCVRFFFVNSVKIVCRDWPVIYSDPPLK